jgi:hypothetical protein
MLKLHAKAIILEAKANLDCHICATIVRQQEEVCLLLGGVEDVAHGSLARPWVGTATESSGHDLAAKATILRLHLKAKAMI